MPDKKISQLTSLAQGDIATTTDVLAIVDTSATETKKATPAAIVGAAAAAGLTNVDINSGAIDGTTIGANSAAAGTFTNLTASGTVSFSGATVSNGGSVTTVDINGGTIDGASVGASSASSGAFTTLSASGSVTLSGGTANGVLYLNGSKVATSGTGLEFDGTNFGVGTGGNTINNRCVIYRGGANAVYHQVANGSTGLTSSNGIRLGLTSGGTGELYSPTALISYIDNAEQMRLTSTGLGIGTSSPGAKFVVSNAGAAGLEVNPIGGVGGGSTIATYNRGTSAYTTLTTYSSAMTWYANGSTRAMDLDSSGNLGIGTSSPAFKLDIAGNARILNSGADSQLLIVAPTDSYAPAVRWAVSGIRNSGILGFPAGDDALVYRSQGASFSTGTECFRVTVGGNFGIGTSSPAAKLDVRSGATADAVEIGSTATTAYNSATSASVLNCRLQLFGGNATNSYTAIRFSHSGSFENFFGAVQNSGGIGEFVWGGYNGSSYGEWLRLTASGNLGLGVTPSAWTGFNVFQAARGSVAATTAEIDVSHNAYYDGAWKYIANGFATNHYQANGAYIWRTAASGTAGNAISFTQAMTLDASGRLLISAGASAPNDATGFWLTNQTGVGPTISGLNFTVQTGSTGSQSERMRLDSSGNLGVGTTSIASGGAGTVNVNFHTPSANPVYFKLSNASTGNTTSDGFDLIAGSDGSALLVNRENQPMIFYTNATERARITAIGDVFVAKTGQALGIVGHELRADGLALHTADSQNILYINRLTNDGDLVQFFQDTTQEGSISVSGNTVSYNAFAGSHWSQLQDGSKPDILRGTVMESINELCVWPDENNERLPKAKISDTVGSKKVYGVFMAWDNDWTETNDMYVTAVGAFICRVNGSVTVQEGDLLESNGDGTARVQADDIIRSSTIGKVTSTVKTHQYDDGSYCVPTVLYCG